MIAYAQRMHWDELHRFLVMPYDIFRPHLFINNHFFQIMYQYLHVEKGTAFETGDQGSARFWTVWEQIDYGKNFTASKKFLTIVPIVLWVF